MGKVLQLGSFFGFSQNVAGTVKSSRLAIAHARSLLEDGQLGAAGDAARSALSDNSSNLNADGRAGLLSILADARVALGDPNAAVRCLEEARSLAGINADLAAEIDSRYAQALLWVFDRQRAATAAAKLCEPGRPADAAAVGHVVTSRLASHIGDFRQGALHSHLAVLAAEAGSGLQAAEAYLYQALALINVDEFEQAEQSIRSARVAVGRRRLLSQELHLLSTEAM